jgi:integrase
MAKPKGHHRSNKLSARAVATATKDVCDGGGLWLQVSAFGTKAWLFKFQRDGKGRKMGLGPLRIVSLAKARELAAAARLKVLEGIDPIEEREAARAGWRLASAKAVTFRQDAEAYIAANRAGWRSAKHAAEWSATLSAYAYPVIGDLSVESVDVALVTKILEPIWATKPVTASRLRGRLESIFDYAKARKHRAGENPAAWKGNLKSILPAASKVASVEHHAALPITDVPTFMSELRAKEGIAARALEFTVLTAARLGEVLGATWSEIDLAGKVWNLPGERMKSGRAHSVPLSPRAMSILEGAPGGGGRIFSVSPMTVQRVMRAMRPGVTIHGTARSSFRDWAGNETNFPRELAEQSLAHVIGNKAEQAYRRSDALERRRALMEQWARFCEAPPAERDNVVDFAKASA